MSEVPCDGGGLSGICRPCQGTGSAQLSITGELEVTGLKEHGKISSPGALLGWQIQDQSDGSYSTSFIL